jgi:hypothetical protein
MLVRAAALHLEPKAAASVTAAFQAPARGIRI